MRERVYLEKTDFPIFLERFLPETRKYVRLQKFKNLDKMEEFSRHLLVAFYLEHGDVEQVGKDIENLISMFPK